MQTRCSPWAKRGTRKRAVSLQSQLRRRQGAAGSAEPVYRSGLGATRCWLSVALGLGCDSVSEVACRGDVGGVDGVGDLVVPGSGACAEVEPEAVVVAFAAGGGVPAGAGVLGDGDLRHGHAAGSGDFGDGCGQFSVVPAVIAGETGNAGWEIFKKHGIDPAPCRGGPT